ncbi:MAG: Bro-N domain-containing protein [Firmicutes bacterium]|nr:Bro-N domain-containing protein [Bacillota bacterium]
MSNIKLFNDKKIRTHWDGAKEEWFFSVVDVVGILTEKGYDDARKYWKVLKMRLKDEGSELVSFCYQLKMVAFDGKLRETDTLDTKGVLRLIQSIPSPRAEPFKLWLAEVGNDRIDEIYDPEKAIQRALNFYRKKGYSEDWINQRLKTIEMRKELTDEWKRVGIKDGAEYAILTDEMTKAWTDMTTRQYKDLKGISKENLRDNMTNLELVLNLLAEQTTKEISITENPATFNESKSIAKRGGSVAKGARELAEKEIKRPIITGKNAKGINYENN